MSKATTAQQASPKPLIAFRAYPKHDPENCLLVFAKRHPRAKSLALSHFQGVKYNSMRAQRETEWDQVAAAHGVAEVIAYNRQLPDGLTYYPEKTPIISKPDFLKAKAIKNAASASKTAHTKQPEAPKKEGAFSKIIKRLFG